MAKKKVTTKKVEVRDCSKCNESITIKDLLYCKMRVQDIKYPTPMGIASFKNDCKYFRLKRGNEK